MTQDMPSWTKTACAAAMTLFQQTEQQLEKHHLLEFHDPRQRALRVRSCPDAQGRVEMGLERPHDLHGMPRHMYREALFQLAALHRNRTTRYIPYLGQNAVEALAADFPSSLVEEGFVQNTLLQLQNMLDEAQAFARAWEEEHTGAGQENTDPETAQDMNASAVQPEWINV